MKKWITLEKKVGETPLDVVEQFKSDYPEYIDTKMAYAGRLDPMASGKLLILLGEECKNQTSYHGLDKEYEVTVLLGAHSDSGDVLGLITAGAASTIHTPNPRTVLKNLIGPFTPPYPIFSSKTVQGKPLHTWTMEGRLREIEIPKQTGHIYKIQLTEIQTLTGTELHTTALQKIFSIPEVVDPRKAAGKNFRRTDIAASWDTLLQQNTKTVFTTLHIRCICSSGTYMRSLAEEIGIQLGTTAFALRIHRTKIGTYRPLPFGLGWWTKTF